MNHTAEGWTAGDWINADGRIRLLHGDCMKRMQELASNSIDSIVTDPPYG